MTPHAVSGMVVGYDRTSNTTGAHVRLEPNPKRVEWFHGFVILSGCDTGRRCTCPGTKPLAASIHRNLLR